jgi:hypothetical protein
MKLLLILISSLSIIFFSFGLANLIVYHNYHICENVIYNNPLTVWIIASGIAYCSIGILFLCSLIFELLFDFTYLTILTFLLGGPFTVGWTIYGTITLLNYDICATLYKMVLSTLIAFYIVIPVSSATLFFVK